jgi:hypothetical protein
MNQISRHRARGLVFGAYPVLGLDIKAFEKFYSMNNGGDRFPEDELSRVELKRFKQYYMAICSIRVNLFLKDVDNYRGSHQPMANYVASTLDKLSIRERDGSLFPRGFGNMEQAYTLEMLKRYRIENPNPDPNNYTPLLETEFKN